MSDQQQMTDKFDKILGQVRALIAKADSTDHKGEEDLLRAKAESLMLKYRIEEALVFEKALGTTDRIVPVWATMNLAKIGNDFAQHYNRIAGLVAQHTGTRVRLEYDFEQDYVVIKACNFSSDLRYMELLLTSCVMEFGKRMEPGVDRSMSDEENAWNLRSAGWTRKRIAHELLGAWSTENEMKAKNRKVTAMIKRHGAAIGEDANALLGRGNSMDTYAQSYIDGFIQTLHSRLYRMRQQAIEMEGGGLVPVSRKEAIDEAFYAVYPDLRPKEETGQVNFTGRSECERCKRAKSGYCREHSYLKPRYVNRPHNSRAYGMGAAAAQSVDLGQHGSPNRLS